MYELIGQARPILYSPEMWERLGGHNPYDDLSITAGDKMKRWHPMNQSLYVGYKVMLAGLLMISKGDRISMHSSVETRYPFLDDDVIQFCSEIAPEYKLQGPDREVDPAPGRRQDPARRRSPTAPRRCSARSSRRPSSAPAIRPGSTSS